MIYYALSAHSLWPDNTLNPFRRDLWKKPITAHLQEGAHKVTCQDRASAPFSSFKLKRHPKMRRAAHRRIAPYVKGIMHVAFPKFGGM